MDILSQTLFSGSVRAKWAISDKTTKRVCARLFTVLLRNIDATVLGHAVGAPCGSHVAVTAYEGPP
jgi:hypothetical protein